MPGHAAHDLIYARLVWGGECDGLHFTWLDFDLPVDIRLVFFIEVTANLCAIFHDDEIMLHCAIVLNLKCDLLAGWNRVLAGCERKIGHIHFDIGGGSP